MGLLLCRGGLIGIWFVLVFVRVLGLVARVVLLERLVCICLASVWYFG